MSFGIRKKSKHISKPFSKTPACIIMDKIIDMEPVKRNKIGNKYIYSSNFKYDQAKHPDVKRETYLSEYKPSLVDSIKEEIEDLFFDKEDNIWKLVKK
jgi:hypothetical protein